jgi:hypothetical protein
MATKQRTSLKQEILDGPVLKRPDYKRRFYVKTDWSQDGMGGALWQPDCNEEEEKAMKREMEGGKCELDKIMSGLRLRLIKTIARACKGSEKHEHSSKGEPRAGRWAFLKWKRFLWYSEFTWITDCSCLGQFFDMDIMPTHTLQRWRMDLLRFNFTIVHRPERMLCECDLLSRYNLCYANATYFLDTTFGLTNGEANKKKSQLLSKEK